MRDETDRGKPRSQSLTREQGCGAKEIQDRMKYTVDFMDKGFKPNTRGDFILDSFATLEELLVELPESTNFDIEISMFQQSS
jgi:glycerophosphodiester phosphodiesterase